MAAVEESENTIKYFCHQCRTEITPVVPDFSCPRCDSGFVEEMGPSFHDVRATQDQEPTRSHAAHRPWNTSTESRPYRPTRRRSMDRDLLSRDRYNTRRSSNTNAATFGSSGRRMASDIYSFLGNLFIGEDASRRRAEEARREALIGDLEGFRSLEGDGLEDIISQLVNQLSSSGGPLPCNQAQLDQLSKISLSQQQLEDIGQCCICMECFIVSEMATLLPCSHYFHTDCIFPWLRQHGTCPICRLTLSSPDTSLHDQFRNVFRQSSTEAPRREPPRWLPSPPMSRSLRQNAEVLDRGGRQVVPNLEDDYFGNNLLGSFSRRNDDLSDQPIITTDEVDDISMIPEFLSSLRLDDENEIVEDSHVVTVSDDSLSSFPDDNAISNVPLILTHPLMPRVEATQAVLPIIMNESLDKEAVLSSSVELPAEVETRPNDLHADVTYCDFELHGVSYACDKNEPAEDGYDKDQPIGDSIDLSDHLFMPRQPADNTTCDLELDGMSYAYNKNEPIDDSFDLHSDLFMPRARRSIAHVNVWPSGEEIDEVGCDCSSIRECAKSSNHKCNSNPDSPTAAEKAIDCCVMDPLGVGCFSISPTVCATGQPSRHFSAISRSESSETNE